MGYDKNSFLAGIAAGRAMKSFPMMEGEKLFSFIIDTRYNTVDGKTFTFCVGEGTSTTTRIYWGDGQSTLVQWHYTPGAGTTGYDYTHTYTVGGVYNIIIDGTISHFEYGNYWTPINTPECLVAIITPFAFEPGFPASSTRIDLQHSFYMCENLIHLPRKLFKALENTNYRECQIYEMFYGCKKIKNFSSDLFEGLPSIAPTSSHDGGNWRDHGPTQFDNAIGGCDLLFYGCESLEGFPEGFFNYSAFETVSCARSMILDCKSFRSIPKRCFSRFVNCETFKYLCYNRVVSTTSSALVEIGEYAFANCEKVKFFGRSFAGCGNAELEIGEGLFEGCDAVENMSRCFYNCYGLKSIPDGVEDMSLVTDWTGTFYDCYRVTSAVPELWISHPTADGSGCFSGCRNASNWSSIPSAWGGPA